MEIRWSAAVRQFRHRCGSQYHHIGLLFIHPAAHGCVIQKIDFFPARGEQFSALAWISLPLRLRLNTIALPAHACSIKKRSLGLIRRIPIAQSFPWPYHLEALAL